VKSPPVFATSDPEAATSIVSLRRPLGWLLVLLTFWAGVGITAIVDAFGDQPWRALAWHVLVVVAMIGQMRRALAVATVDAEGIRVRYRWMPGRFGRGECWRWTDVQAVTTDNSKAPRLELVIDGAHQTPVPFAPIHFRGRPGTWMQTVDAFTAAAKAQANAAGVLSLWPYDEAENS
jgi:hypothetical protein